MQEKEERKKLWWRDEENDLKNMEKERINRRKVKNDERNNT